MNKKTIMGIVALVIVIVAGVGVYYYTLPAPSAELTQIDYLLGWIPTSQNYLGFYVAMHNGWYTDVGIKLNMIPYAAGTTPGAQQLAAGQVNFAELSTLGLVTSNAAGLGLELIAAGYQRNPGAFFTFNSSIKTPKDWEGKNVAVNPSSSGFAQYLSVLNASGADRSKINEITTDYAQYVTMATGRIDVTTGTYISDMYAIGKMGYPNGTKSWYILPTAYGFNAHTSCIAVRQEWLKDPKNYDLALRFMTVTQKGFEWAFTHFGEALDIFLQYNPNVNPVDEYNMGFISVTQCANTTEVWQHGWGWIQQSTVEKNAADLFKYGIVNQAINVTEGSSWTNALVNAAYTANHK